MKKSNDRTKSRGAPSRVVMPLAGFRNARTARYLVPALIVLLVPAGLWYAFRSGRDVWTLLLMLGVAVAALLLYLPGKKPRA